MVTLRTIDDLAEELVKKGFITKDQLAVARVSQKNLGGDIGQVLIKKGFISREDLLQVVVDKLQLQLASIKSIKIDPASVNIVPMALAQKHHFMPISKEGEVLVIAMADPLAIFALEEIKEVVKCSIRPLLTSQDEIDAAIRLHYHAHDESALYTKGSIEVEDQTWDEDLDTSEKLEELASGSKVVNVVNGLIVNAYSEHSSDIHIEPRRGSAVVRYRIDGLLEERAILEKKMLLPIVSRLKIMAGMDIAERRVPQDGRVRMKLLGNQLDLRLSTYPTMYGEKVVIRLLAREGIIGLEDLGFSEDDKNKFANIITRPHGIFLVTGPTGSGKTTTLYAALQRVNSQEKNIISIEDPIENEIVGVAQAQVNVKAGVTFASALRAILRQDPDIIMVGEIRDTETADIAVRSAITGHLVFSTLHTNTAVGSIARLMDLGVEPFLLSSALLGVLSQRLVRKICLACKTARDASPEQLAYLGKKEKLKLYHGAGCKKCRMSGYIGRVGLFELVIIDDKLKHMITERAPEDELRKVARQAGARDIREDGIAKMLAGVTTLEEVIRVTQGD